MPWPDSDLALTVGTGSVQFQKTIFDIKPFIDIINMAILYTDTVVKLNKAVVRYVHITGNYNVKIFYIWLNYSCKDDRTTNHFI